MASVGPLDPPPPTGSPTSRTPVTGGYSYGVAYDRSSSQSILTKRVDAPIATVGELAGLAATGIFGNFALRTGFDSVAGTLTVLALGALLLGGERVQRREARRLVMLAMLLAPWLSIRTAGGLTLVTGIAIVALLTFAGAFSMAGRLKDSSFVSLVMHGWSQLGEWAYGLQMVKRAFDVERFGSGRGEAFARGLFVAIPVVALFAALLASADEVFKSFISLDGFPSVVGHLLVAVVAAVVAGGFLSRSAHATHTSTFRIPRFMTALEVLVVLGAMSLLFAGFVVTQIVVALGGVQNVLETANLTQAEHARSGFFQLLWVSGLTLTLLGWVRGVRTRDISGARDPFVPLALVIVVLTLAITGVSIQRLLLYVGSFGLTALRFWALIAAFWIGILLVGYAVAITHRGRGAERDGEYGPASAHSWFPMFVLLSAVAIVFGLNVVNPDGFVAWYNVSHGPQVIDTLVLADLSGDSAGSIRSFVTDPTNEVPDELASRWCSRPDDASGFGLLGWNWADTSRSDLVDSYCGQ